MCVARVIGVEAVDWLQAEYEAIDNSNYGLFHYDDLTDEGALILCPFQVSSTNCIVPLNGRRGWEGMGDVRKLQKMCVCV